jgi:hypothetical protein
MPAQIVNGICSFLQGQLNVNVWDGEIPRTGLQGEPINPDAALLDWPVIRAVIDPAGFRRTYTFEDPYDDRGTVTVQAFSTRRDQAESLGSQIEALLEQAANWAKISTILASPAFGGDPSNPYYVIQLLLETWWSGQEEDVRLGKSQLLYRFDLVYDVHIHGAIVSL